MSGNIFGRLFRISSFGESHGAGIGVVIDGCPSNITIDLKKIQDQLDRRRPGQSEYVSQRNEKDQLQVLSGLYNGKSTGAPICIFIQNKDQKPGDYNHLEKAFRPSHADFTYQEKYKIRDHQGGGRSSARETIARVVAGSVAQQILSLRDIYIKAYVSQIGPIKMNTIPDVFDADFQMENAVKCPDKVEADKMMQLIEQLKTEGDTTGGKITCVVKNCPAGLGEPVFEKLHANLGKAMLSINACKGFEIGSGFEGVSLKGSVHNDPFIVQDGQVKTKTNFSGGIQGGISNGMDIHFNVAFKPVSTIMQQQQSINQNKESIQLEATGRHDPCVVPRAVPIVESMAALVVLDALLIAESTAGFKS